MNEKESHKSLNSESMDWRNQPQHSVTTNSKINSESFTNFKNIFEAQFIKISNDKKNRQSMRHSEKALTLINYPNTNLTGNVVTLQINDEKRKDRYGCIIRKGGKQHKISFKEVLVETVQIDSYKEYHNKITIVQKKTDCNCQIL